MPAVFLQKESSGYKNRCQVLFFVFPERDLSQNYGCHSFEYFRSLHTFDHSHTVTIFYHSFPGNGYEFLNEIRRFYKDTV